MQRTLPWWQTKGDRLGAASYDSANGDAIDQAAYLDGCMQLSKRTMCQEDKRFELDQAPHTKSRGWRYRMLEARYDAVAAMGAHALKTHDRKRHANSMTTLALSRWQHGETGIRGHRVIASMTSY